jgi:hypothetical protein
MSGLGAWSFGFYHQGMSVPNDRVAAGLLAFKQAMIDNGHAEGIDLTAPHFGHSMDKQVRAFQRAQGITVDGVFGPTTARYAFRHYSFAYETADTVEIPDHLLQKTGGEESGHDPVAQGFEDDLDEGWAQQHRPYFPNLRLSQLWDPRQAITSLGSSLKTFYVNDAADWDGAVAHWNVGTTGAILWVQAGKPAVGVFVTLADGTKIDVAPRATRYVLLVKQQPA